MDEEAPCKQLSASCHFACTSGTLSQVGLSILVVCLILLILHLPTDVQTGSLKQLQDKGHV